MGTKETAEEPTAETTGLRTIRIIAGDVEAIAHLNESQSAAAIWDALPIEARGSRWGEEIYFSIPLDLAPEDPQEVVDSGDLAYWPPGNAFCIFFGRTPASVGDEVRPASPVNVVGRVQGAPTIFKRVRDGARVVIDRESA